MTDTDLWRERFAQLYAELQDQTDAITDDPLAHEFASDRLNRILTRHADNAREATRKDTP